MKKSIALCMVLFASLFLFDFVSMWTAHESVPEFQLIKVDAVTGATACTDGDGDHFCAELGFDCGDTDPKAVHLLHERYLYFPLPHSTQVICLRCRLSIEKNNA